MAGSALAAAMARHSANSSPVETKIFSWAKNPAGRAARCTTSSRRSPCCSRRRASWVDTRKRWVATSRPPAGLVAVMGGSAGLQRRHVDDETILHVLLHEAVPGLVDLLDGDHLHVAG